MHESFPDSPEIGAADIELLLNANVHARWRVDKDLYGGFLSLRNGPEEVEFTFPRNSGSEFGLAEPEIASAAATFDVPWMATRSISQTQQELRLLAVVSDDGIVRGANQCQLTLTIAYPDGTSDTFASTVFVHIEE